MLDVGHFLQRELTGLHPWNCTTLPADWCIELGYPDLAAGWRNITDCAEGERITREAGGLVALWERGIGDKLAWASEPWEAGDVAVVRLLEFEAGAIFTGKRWAIRGERGLAFLAVDQVECVRAWRP